MRLLERPFPFGLGPRNWLLFLVGAAALILIVLPFDHQLSVAGTTLPEGIRGFFLAITDLGLSDWILYPSAILFILTALLAFAMRSKPKPRRALVQMAQLYAFIFLGVAIPGLIANLIKRIVGRGRPEVFDSGGSLSFEHIINDWTYQSFVSGHSATIFATAFVISFLSPRWFWPAMVVAVLVAISRVVVGAHYPSDVIAGAIVGTIVAYAVRNLFASRRILFEPGPNETVVLRPFSAVKRLVRKQRRTTR